MRLRMALFAFLVLTFVASIEAGDKIVSCYVTPSLSVAKIDPLLCTHLMLIGSTTLNFDGTAKMPEPKELKPLVGLKGKSKDLKVFLTLTPPNDVVSQLVVNETLMEAYVRNVTNYLIANDIDGFDLDWEFPVWSQSAKKTDKSGLSNLVKAFRKSFDCAPKRLGLSLAVSAPFTITRRAYDIDVLNECSDFVQVMNYDFHFYAKGTPFVGLNAPLFPLKYEFMILKKLNSDYSTFYWLSNGLSAQKLVFGIPTYGRGFRLLSDRFHIPYSPATGPSDLFGDFVSFPQICEALSSTLYTQEWSDIASSPYIHGQKQWISYENVLSSAIKANHAKILKLRGIMLFDLDMDDVEGVCGFGETYPLIRAAKSAFLEG
ncbi:hypothetical protein L596_018680 [Steinernema carpocapsae]|uniref:GH18 domain-containing protein n=1 Tax=Steinernema carpocapsae TaxID=34508 RepID=A0A4U5N5D1_STECR|nr:hypothetical protein L596_018680 [Steinernema carpocapsae]